MFRDPLVVLSVCLQVCAACLYLREKHVLHRDLKTPNILARRMEDGSMMVKLADFDTAIECDEEERRDDEPLCGTFAVSVGEVAMPVSMYLTSSPAPCHSGWHPRCLPTAGTLKSQTCSRLASACMRC